MALTTVVAVGAPASAAPSAAKHRYITDGFEFPSREQARKHLPELRRKVIENAGKPKRQREKPAETPADAIQRGKTGDCRVRRSVILVVVGGCPDR